MKVVEFWKVWDKQLRVSIHPDSVAAVEQSYDTSYSIIHLLDGTIFHVHCGYEEAMRKLRNA